MANHKHPHSTLIDRIGGRIVRDRLGLSPQSLYNWKTRGVPPAKRVLFAKLAAEFGLAVPADFFGEELAERAA